MVPLNMTSLDTAELEIRAFQVRLVATEARQMFLADVAVQTRDDDGGGWRQIRATQMSLAYVTEALLDVLVDSLCGLYRSGDRHVRVTAAVQATDGRVQVAYQSAGPTYSAWPRHPADLGA